MLEIKKLRADHVIDFAAEELKKYLRMMMPQAGDVAISYEPEAASGFRLGLLEDHGLPNEAEDPYLDDIVHIEADARGGILAGSNPRSVLFAVYRFFKENGARWLYPGIDGEYIPIKDIQPVNYHKAADHRFRGQCNEGAEFQQCMMETIDFYVKLEMNVYMIEGHYGYYDSYYNHLYNQENRPPEPVAKPLQNQWKRQCEVEIAKRGLQFHDMGHGWTAEPFGIRPGTRIMEEKDLPEGMVDQMAMINGKRGLYRSNPVTTNLCMSNPEVRATMVRGIADYAERSRNSDYIHVWLADYPRNHCECPECVKMRPADYYMMIMNELDEELTARQLQSRIVFIAYVDTLWAPEHIFIKNPKRFSLLYAPYYRTYSASFPKGCTIPPEPEYIRNHWEYVRSVEGNAAFLQAWKQHWKGPCFNYEYHFYIHQYYDPGLTMFSRRIYEDVLSMRDQGLDGMVEDGSQRPFFPHGFCMYIYAEALFDRDCDYEALRADYFRHIYGDQWQAVDAYLQKMTETFDFSFMAGEKSLDPAISRWYHPAMAEQLQKVKAIAAEGRAIAEGHLHMPTRPQTVSMRLLLRHAEYCEGVAEFMSEKALGHDERARELWEAFAQRFGRYELEMERYYDHFMAMYCFDHTTKLKK